VKLRIEKDSLRLRLKQNEVASLLADGIVECSIRFSHRRQLRYSVASSPVAAVVSVNYRDGAIRVVLPHAIAIAWAESTEIAVEGAASDGVHILVEKDFRCLHKPAESDLEAYPNPMLLRK